MENAQQGCKIKPYIPNIRMHTCAWRKGERERESRTMAVQIQHFNIQWEATPSHKSTCLLCYTKKQNNKKYIQRIYGEVENINIINQVDKSLLTLEILK